MKLFFPFHDKGHEMRQIKAMRTLKSSWKNDLHDMAPKTCYIKTGRLPGGILGFFNWLEASEGLWFGGVWRCIDLCALLGKLLTGHPHCLTFSSNCVSIHPYLFVHKGETWVEILKNGKTVLLLNDLEKLFWGFWGFAWHFVCVKPNRLFQLALHSWLCTRCFRRVF